MTSSITFEIAAFADVIKKASKVAPTKGTAFDKAAGIVIEFDPSQTVPLAVVRATNLDVFSLEWMNVSEWAGEAARWRLPSALLSLVVGSLPIGTGKLVTMSSEHGAHNFVVNLKSDRTKAKFYPMRIEDYPQWGAFDPDKMYPASDLGGRLSQVEWACSSSDLHMSGVYLDGEWAIATDRYRLARVPLSIPDLAAPIIVPSGVLSQILKQTGDVQIGFDGHLLNIMPDEYSQVKAVIYDVQFPKVQGVMDRELDTEVSVDRDALLEKMMRVTSFGQSDRVSSLRIFWGKSEIAFYMSNLEIGQIGDVMEVPNQIEHARFEQRFTAKNLTEAIAKAPNKDLKLAYNYGDPKSIVRIDGGSGYTAWVMPRTDTGEKE